MSKSIITDYENISVFSGKPTTTKHHCIFGRGKRNLADQDGLWIPVTDEEHNLSSKGSTNQIHGNPIAEFFSKVIGELAWERNYLAKIADTVTGEKSLQKAKDEFRKRYGKNYL